MAIDPLVRDVFGRFQNLNLAVLIHDLYGGRTVRGRWSSLDDRRSLCPISHGMADGAIVEQLRWASQAIDIEKACSVAAWHLGTHPITVYRFVRQWDSLGWGTGWLIGQLEELWADRLADADTVQEILEPLAEARGESSAEGGESSARRRKAEVGV